MNKLKLAPVAIIGAALLALAPTGMAFADDVAPEQPVIEAPVETPAEEPAPTVEEVAAELPVPEPETVADAVVLDTPPAVIEEPESFSIVLWHITSTTSDHFDPDQEFIGRAEVSELIDVSAAPPAKLLALIGEDETSLCSYTIQADEYDPSVTFGPGSVLRWAGDGEVWPNGTGYKSTYSQVFSTPECEEEPPPVIEECTTYTSDIITDLALLDTSSTSSLANGKDGSGHVALGASDLHVWTDAEGTRKSSGYITGIGWHPLSQLGEFKITGTGTGTAPGGQLDYDLQGDGIRDGYLVIEELYGGIQWLSVPAGGTWVPIPGAPHTAGGGGYPNQGTFNEWLAAFPDSQWRTPGYSLGSGSTGDWRIDTIEAGCHVTAFGAPAAPEPETRNYTITGEDECREEGGGTRTDVLVTEQRDPQAWDEATQSYPWGEWYETGREDVTVELGTEECPVTEVPPTDPPTEEPPVTTPPTSTPDGLAYTAYEGDDAALLITGAVTALVLGAMAVAAAAVKRRSATPRYRR